jgi:hypothetical protein
MNFLERFNFTVRPLEQEIHLEPVRAGHGAAAPRAPDRRDGLE